MATNTLLPDSEEKTTNPNESDEVFRSRHGVAKGLEDLENHANSGGDNSGPVGTQEENPDSPQRPGYSGEGSYYNNFTGAEKAKLKSINGAHFLRKKGPLGIIITIVLGGGIGFTALFSPGLLIVQMKEVMVSKFNTQLASMDVRTNKILSIKMDGTTKGICGSIITIGCKYSTMTDKQVQAFKNAGIEIESDTPGAKRVKPTGFRYNGGKSIPASEFSKALSSSDSGFRTAVRNAYNPKYAGFSDSKWSKFAQRIGVRKSPNLKGNTDAERTANLDESTKNGAPASATGKVVPSDIDPETGKPYSDAPDGGKAKVAQINNAADTIANETKAAAKSGATAVGAVEGAEAAVKNGVGTVANFFKITGAVDTACQAYGAVQTVGYAAKTVRAIQLARYAMVFFNVADQIKAGTAKPGDVAYLGTILTSLALDAKNAAKRGSATDSYGYKFAAYGDSGPMKSNFTSQFLAGGGLTGDLINIVSIINNATGGNAKSTCKTLANPWVQAGSLIGGVALMFVPVAGQAGVAAKDVIVGALQVTFSIAMAVLPEMLKDIVAGNVTHGLVGEDSGDAMTSGAGGLMGGVANVGGNGAMTKADAMAYNDLQTKTIAMYNQDEAKSLSPLDATNKNTFLGSIVFSLLPYSSQFSTLSGGLSSIGSIVTGAFSNIVPKTNALSDAQYQASLNVCTDYDYTAMKIATDPFCNVIYGIPPKYLNKDPLVVNDELTGQIDPQTGDPIGDYATFVSDCIDRSEPLGSDAHGDSGSKCVINDSNANYYLHYVDQRVNNGMSGDDPVLAANSAGQQNDISFYSTNDTSNVPTTTLTDATTTANAQPVINSVQKPTTSTLSNSMNQPSVTPNICRVSDINNRVPNLDILCSNSYLGFIKIKGLAL